MTTSPAGWHQDPLGRHQFRYWDGAQWTEHVSDAGVVGLDAPRSEATPESMAGAQAHPDVPEPESTPRAVARRVHVDAQLRIGFHQRRLFADDHALWWGEDAYRYADMTAVTWGATRVVAGPAHNFEYRITVWQGKKAKTIAFGGRGDYVRAAYDHAVEAVLRHAGTRLITDILRTIEGGETAVVARVALSQSGAEFGKRHLDWATPFRLVPYSSQRMSMVAVRVHRDGKDKGLGEYAASVQNASLLPYLLETLAHRYRPHP